MPWRHTADPYRIMVSEIMLQQTQVARVIPKYEQFIQRFPDVTALAGAPLADVVAAWVGLGYNRRARFLHQAAAMVIEAYGGEFPTDSAGLQSLPGIGSNTAGAIMAYAYNRPVVFIETNIRTVYIHHFLSDESAVADAAIRHLLEQTLDETHPREWYWALMDYGTHLKATRPSNLAQSRHYKKQSRFEGSLRQVRGAIVRELAGGAMPEESLRQTINDTYAAAGERFDPALSALLAEGMVERHGTMISLTGSGQVS